MSRIQFITNTSTYNKRNLIKIFLKKAFKKAGVHAAYLHLPDNHSTHKIKMAKEQGAHNLLTNCLPCILFLEQGLELMREAGEPMEFGIFDFHKVFSKAFGEEGDGAGGMSSRTYR